MKLIPLTQGYFAMVDDWRFDELSQKKWCAKKSKWTVYARRLTNGRVKDGYKSTSLHRHILGICDPNIHVDHIDGNGLNCQEHNLRASTCSENMRNSRLSSASTTGYKGVSMCRTMGMFRAYIVKNYKQTALGYSECPKTCARTYNVAAKEMFNEFAKLNDVDDGPLCPPIGGMVKTNTSGFFGVSFNKRNGKWEAQLVKDKKKVLHKYFKTKEDAARAYDAKAIEIYGPSYKKLNLPLETPTT